MPLRLALDNSEVAAFMPAHSKTPYITPSTDFSYRKGVVRGRRGQQLGFALTPCIHVRALVRPSHSRNRNRATTHRLAGQRHGWLVGWLVGCFGLYTADLKHLQLPRTPMCRVRMCPTNVLTREPASTSTPSWDGQASASCVTFFQLSHRRSSSSSSSSSRWWWWWWWWYSCYWWH